MSTVENTTVPVEEVAVDAAAATTATEPIVSDTRRVFPFISYLRYSGN